MFFDNRQSRRFGLALWISLVLHGLVVGILVLRTNLHPASQARPTRDAHHLIVQLKTNQPASAHAVGHPPESPDRPRPTAQNQPARNIIVERAPTHLPALGVTVRKPLPDSAARDLSLIPPATSDIAAEMKHEPLDMDALRAQARMLADESGPDSQGQRHSVPSSGKNAKKSEALLDRPALPALAHHIQAPPDDYVETTMTDGSRVIRFSGNRCMKIPRELPLGFKNDHGPNIIVATNCPK